MNANELMEKWPGIAGADAASVFGMDAWALPIGYNGKDAKLIKDATRERDVIGLAIRFEQDEHFLAIALSDAYPELSKVWEQKSKLPDEILLALIEKECGALLQTLENAARRQLSVVGLVPREDVGAKNAAAQAFAIVGEDGETVCDFSLSMSPALLREFGRIDNLDAGHVSVRALTRPGRAEYAAFMLTEDELAGLASGDHLLLPEVGSGVAEWRVEPPQDDRVHVFSAETTDLSFGGFADGSLPAPSAPAALILVRGDRTLAEGRLTRLGDHPAFSIESTIL